MTLVPGALRILAKSLSMNGTVMPLYVARLQAYVAA